MDGSALSELSFGALRDRLKAQWEHPNDIKEIDIDEALHYLIAIPHDKHNEESIDTLIYLVRIFNYDAQPTKLLQASSHAAELAAAAGNKLQLWAARAGQAIALADLGRYSEAIVANVAAWSLGCELGDKRREVSAILSFGTLCGAMGQWEVASRYLERAQQLAEAAGLDEIELLARNNLADCAVQLRVPSSGLRALSGFVSNRPQNRDTVVINALAHNTLARLHWLTGDFGPARAHAEEAARLAKAGGAEKSMRYAAAVLGLIDVSSGLVEIGLASVENALTLSKAANHSQLPDYLGMCIDAYEASGDLDKALQYLRELVEHKKNSIATSMMPLQWEGLHEPIRFQLNAIYTDDLARVHQLRTMVQTRLDRVIETAINAEIASGYDLYRTFRVAKLARHLATEAGWSEERLTLLTLGARLCNIGMMAIPTSILQKPRTLTTDQQNVLRDHTRYGGELLRKPKIEALSVAALIAEQHHERFDGSGYPIGLAGKSISEEARVVAICDAFDAMTHRRPSRGALTAKAALNDLKRQAGSQFDPRLVSAFVDLFERELAEHEDLDAFLAQGADEFEYVRARARMDALLTS